MHPYRSPALTRRDLLAIGAAVGTTAALPSLARHAAAAPTEHKLVAAPDYVPLVGAHHPETEVWGYNGTIPGPQIRVRQGDRLRVLVENRLDEETTVHWHGIRLPNRSEEHTSELQSLMRNSYAV